MDSKSLEYHCGVIKVRNDLEKMSKEIGVGQRQRILRTVPPKRWVSTGSSATKERERFDKTVRSRAMKELRRRERDIAVELKEYKPYLDADVQTIKEFPEAIGSPKTKRQLIKSTFQYTTFSLLACTY